MSSQLHKIQAWESLAQKSDYSPINLAALCLVSTRQLERFFKERFQVTPTHWIRIEQCRVARLLILEGYANKAVAHQLRFANESHFCREFKKVTGISPRTYLYESKSPKMPLIDKNVANGQ